MPATSLSQRLKMLVEWSPVLSLATKISNAKTDHEFALGVADLCSFLAARTHVEYDDALVSYITSIIKSDEGKALIEWGRRVLDGLAVMEMPPPEELVHD